jgi:hypothetical protein
MDTRTLRVQIAPVVTRMAQLCRVHNYWWRALFVLKWLVAQNCDRKGRLFPLFVLARDKNRRVGDRDAACLESNAVPTNLNLYTGKWRVMFSGFECAIHMCACCTPPAHHTAKRCIDE